jgi:hypothetical protein
MIEQVLVQHGHVKRLMTTAGTGAGLPQLDLGDGVAPGMPRTQAETGA